MSSWKKIVPVITLSLAASFAVTGCVAENADEPSAEPEVAAQSEDVGDAQQALLPIDFAFISHFRNDIFPNVGLGAGFFGGLDPVFGPGVPSPFGLGLGAAFTEIGCCDRGIGGFGCGGGCGGFGGCW